MNNTSGGLSIEGDAIGLFEFTQDQYEELSSGGSIFPIVPTPVPVTPSDPNAIQAKITTITDARV